MKKVIIITGPCGAGKTTIAELFEKECGYVFLDGDNEDTEFFDKFRKAFGDDLQIVVLFPEQSEIVIRDKKRECWTTGVDRIKAVYCEFEKHRAEVGETNYIDTSGQTAKETFKKYFKC